MCELQVAGTTEIAKLSQYIHTLPLSKDQLYKVDELINRLLAELKNNENELWYEVKERGY